MSVWFCVWFRGRAGNRRAAQRPVHVPTDAQGQDVRDGRDRDALLRVPGRPPAEPEDVQGGEGPDQAAVDGSPGHNQQEGAGWLGRVSGQQHRVRGVRRGSWQRWQAGLGRPVAERGQDAPVLQDVDVGQRGEGLRDHASWCSRFVYTELEGRYHWFIFLVVDTGH